MKSTRTFIASVLIFSALFLYAQPESDRSGGGGEASLPSLPIGMNLPGISPSTAGYVFNDVMTTASTWKTFSAYEWDSGKGKELVLDRDGYPLFLPQRTSDGQDSKARFLINDHYKGRFRILYDGEGTFTSSQGYFGEDRRGYYVDLSGSGHNVWIDISYSNKDDHVRNVHIVSEEFDVYTNREWESLKERGGYETFHPLFLESIEDFRCLRFMDWAAVNGSDQMNWEDRKTATYYTQAGRGGISFDYAVELCNQLQADAWVCVPHQASDEYIRNLALLWESRLDRGLKVYLEYSNELWNWVFEQAHYVDDNAPGSADRYVSSDLRRLSSYVRKDAYMMARTFRIWEEVFGEGSERLVRVATGQHAWPDHSRVILEHLFEEGDRRGCDALAVGGYFYFSKESHQEWQEEGKNLSFETIYRDTSAHFPETTAPWTRESAAHAHRYGVDFLVYEGGQHMQPYRQEEWSYNQKLYDFQIHSRMYDLYLENFALHAEEEVGCQLFMAYSLVSDRESKWGSWGHLESMEQVGGGYEGAPKFRALLDVNQ
ncbi:MAG: hypothetical protein PQJ60_09415 [Spirochaetales bacterium]|nr:hypothetical protein [Spirochaetales bacterium]